MKPLVVSLACLLALLPAVASAQQADNGAARRSSVSKRQEVEPPIQKRSRNVRNLDRALRQRDQATERMQRIQKPLTGQTSRPANSGRSVVPTQ